MASQSAPEEILRELAKQGGVGGGWNTKPCTHVLLTFDMRALWLLCLLTLLKSKCRISSVAGFFWPTCKLAENKHLVLWICSFRGQRSSWVLCVYLALCLSQLHSKQQGLTPSVQPPLLWNIYCCISLHLSLFIYMFLPCFEEVRCLASTFQFMQKWLQRNYWGLTCDHVHALHSISDQFQHEEIPGFMKCGVWLCPFPHRSNRLPHLSKLYEQWCSQISQPDLFKSILGKGQKQQLKTSEEHWERGIFLVIWLYVKMSTDVETGYTMEHYRNVCQQCRKTGEM